MCPTGPFICIIGPAPLDSLPPPNSTLSISATNPPSVTSRYCCLPANSFSSAALPSKYGKCLCNHLHVSLHICPCLSKESGEWKNQVLKLVILHLRQRKIPSGRSKTVNLTLVEFKQACQLYSIY